MSPMHTSVNTPHTNPENTTGNAVKAAGNPLQQLTGGGQEASIEPKQNPFLSATAKSNYNPLQLIKRTVSSAPPPAQLISDFSKAVLEIKVIPLLQKFQSRERDLPAAYNDALAALIGCLMDDDKQKTETQVAEEAISAFFEAAFGHYRLALGLGLLEALWNEIDLIRNRRKNPLLAVLAANRIRMQQAIQMPGYVDIDPASVDKNAPAPQPLLRGLIWNLHGFSNVISGADRADFKETQGPYHDTRSAMVNSIMHNLANRDTDGSKTDDLKQSETAVREKMRLAGIEELASVASPLLTLEQAKAMLKFLRTVQPEYTVDFLESAGIKYRVKAEYRNEVIDILENCQRALGDNQQKSFNAIDKLLNLLRANEVVHKLSKDYSFISSLLDDFKQASLPQDGDEPALLSLISRVKELRRVIKVLSTFQAEGGANPLHGALGNLSKALNALVNRDNTKDYVTNDTNLAVYLDKELNKYAIVSHLTSLLKDNRLNLDFMLLNEMNRGIQSFTNEIDTATGHKYKVAQGPQMAAMSQKGTGSQREYYPLVYDQQKFEHKGYFYVGVQRNNTVADNTNDKQVIEWMKPEKRKKAGTLAKNTYLDYRPIIVHRLTRKQNGPVQDQPEIWLAAVHTTPYGTEFERQRIFKELEGPLKNLNALAKDKKAELIIGGDFYIAAEAVAKAPTGVMRAATKDQNRPGMLTHTPSPGDQNQNRNLRNGNLEVSSFTKHLSGDIHPGTGWENDKKSMGLTDLRTVTGTNKNSKGLQSADYFVLPGADKNRVRVGLIDPRTRAIVELETDEQQISKHNFFFSDHLISAIEKYATPGDKEKAQAHSRLNQDKLGMLPGNVNALKQNPKSEKYDIGDFEPQAGTSSIITTVLFRAWSILDTRLQTASGIDPVLAAKLAELMKWIDLTRLHLKNRAFTPDDKSNLNQLTGVLQSLGDDTIKEYAELVQSMVDHLPDTNVTSPEDTYRAGLALRETLQENQLEITSGPHAPSGEQLPAYISATFGKKPELITPLYAANDAGAIANALQHSREQPVRNLIAALQKANTIDDPEVIRLIGAAGFSVYVYRLAFFQQSAKNYVNVLRYRYGRGLPLELHILEVMGQTLQPRYIHSGYYQLG